MAWENGAKYRDVSLWLIKRDMPLSSALIFLVHIFSVDNTSIQLKCQWMDSLCLAFQGIEPIDSIPLNRLFPAEEIREGDRGALSPFKVIDKGGTGREMG